MGSKSKYLNVLFKQAFIRRPPEKGIRIGDNDRMNILKKLQMYKDMARFYRDQAGQGAVQTVIVVAATLFVGIKIIAEIAGSISGLTGTANSTYISVEGYLWTGIGFLGLGLLVLGAMYILGIIGNMGGRR